MRCLKLVPPASAPPGDPFTAKRRSEPGRPADHLEPWPISPAPLLRAVALAATARHLHLDTAITVLCELHLAVEDLASSHCSIEMLDLAARDGYVERELPGADAAYLRSLLHGAEIGHEPTLNQRQAVALPARISVRVAQRGGPTELLDPEQLDRAVAWEAAAIIEGRTLGEWVAWRACRLRW